MGLVSAHPVSRFPATEVLPVVARHTFDHPEFGLDCSTGRPTGIGTVGVGLAWLGDWWHEHERILRGTRFVQADELARRTRIKTWRRHPNQVVIGGVPIPLSL